MNELVQAILFSVECIGDGVNLGCIYVKLAEMLYEFAIPILLVGLLMGI